MKNDAIQKLKTHIYTKISIKPINSSSLNKK